MAIEIVPEWMRNLEDEDLVFIKKFVLASGSMKEMAEEYGVTYPTVRLRLDRLIQKIRAKTERKWPGLVLPGVTFLYSLLVLFAFASPDSIAPGSGVSIVGASVSFFFAFLIANIPTFVFLAIYFAVREKKKRDEQMEKMHIKDL